MSKPLMLVSQNNSGSTWFSRCLRKGLGLTGPDKEYFNPVLNHKRQKVLVEAFGSEVSSNVPQLAARVSQETIDRVLEKTWYVDGLDFTKENFSVFRIPQLAKHFDFVFLHRTLEHCFPPERGIRVMVWYVNWFDSLTHNQRWSRRALRFFSKRGQLSFEEKAVCAWLAVHWRLSSYEGYPHVSYRDLVSGDRDTLKSLLPEGVVSEILESRSTEEEQAGKRHRFMPEWEHAFVTARDFEEECKVEQIKAYESDY